MERSRAAGSHELGLDPYKGPVGEKGRGLPSGEVELEALGVWLSENKDGSTGA
jgi:hypothetical protein